MPTCYRHPGRETYISCQRCGRPICPDCMRDAAVGFHCPSCVAEGAKSTRAGRTAYGGLRPGNPGLVSMVLIGLNAAVWLALTASGGSGSRLLDLLAQVSRGRCEVVGQDGFVYTNVADGAICRAQPSGHWVAGVADGAYWQLVTSMFTHVSLLHIAFNMFALWVLGPQLELVLGRARFLAVYLLSGLAGSVTVYWLTEPYVSTVGASGAIFGLMGALVVVAVKVRGNVSSILVWIGINALITFFGASFISWQGHLGGLVGGLVVGAALVYAPRRSRAPVQVAALVTVGIVLAVLTVVRTAALV